MNTDVTWKLDMYYTMREKFVINLICTKLKENKSKTSQNSISWPG